MNYSFRQYFSSALRCCHNKSGRLNFHADSAELRLTLSKLTISSHQEIIPDQDCLSVQNLGLNPLIGEGLVH